MDVTQNYRAAFYSCAAGMGLGAVFLGLVHPAKTGQLCSRRDNGQNNPIVKQVSKDKPEEILEVDNQDIKSWKKYFLCEFSLTLGTIRPGNNIGKLLQL